MNMGLFYGSSTCYTEMAAEKIRDIIGPELVTLHNLKDDSPKLMEQYDVLILGIPTWDFGEIQEDWEAVWDQLDDLNLEGKIVALYGLGDQLGYGEWFLDALGMLHDNCSWVWHWTKLTSMTLATSVFRAGASKSSTKWQSITPDVTDGLAHRLCRHLYLCVSCCNNIRRKSRHSASSMLSAASHKCCLLPLSERKRSIMPLLIIHGALTMLHSCPCQRKRPSINRRISPWRALMRRWLRTQSNTTSESNTIHNGV